MRAGVFTCEVMTISRIDLIWMSKLCIVGVTGVRDSMTRVNTKCDLELQLFINVLPTRLLALGDGWMSSTVITREHTCTTF